MTKRVQCLKCTLISLRNPEIKFFFLFTEVFYNPRITEKFCFCNRDKQENLVNSFKMVQER